MAPGMGFRAYTRAQGPALAQWLPWEACASAFGLGPTAQLTTCLHVELAPQTSGAWVGQTKADASVSHPPWLSSLELVSGLGDKARCPRVPELPQSLVDQAQFSMDGLFSCFF